MVNTGPVYIGVDVGASRTKVAILDAQSNLIGRSVARTGIDFAATALRCRAEAMQMAGVDEADIAATLSTGYGRNNVAFARNSRTEIGCHGKGCFHYLPMAQSIIDIGGQDNKIIKLDAHGKRSSFKMNRKCAAGTGAFLEEMAMRLDVPLEKMDQLAAQAEGMIKMGSYCTVFSATEVLTHIRNGEKLAYIVKGLFYSMIKRVLEMDALTDTVVMTGGVVAHNPYMVKYAQEILGIPIRTPEFPQFTGAVGAALFAKEETHSGQKRKP
jgi:predicted CoA-substrate-specific enzyme activase